MPHPLDPLSALELTQAVASFRSQHYDDWAFFSSAGLVELPKTHAKSGVDELRIVKLLGIDSTPVGGSTAAINIDNRDVS